MNSVSETTEITVSNKFKISQLTVVIGFFIGLCSLMATVAAIVSTYSSFKTELSLLNQEVDLLNAKIKVLSKTDEKLEREIKEFNSGINKILIELEKIKK